MMTTTGAGGGSMVRMGVALYRVMVLSGGDVAMQHRMTIRGVCRAAERLLGAVERDALESGETVLLWGRRSGIHAIASL